MPVTNFFHTFVMSYLLVLNEFIFASLVLTYGRGMLQHLPFCVICAVNCLLCFHSLYSVFKRLTTKYLFYHDCIYNHRTTKTNQKYPSVNL